MSVNIITGYTGQRHITPYMDAAVNRGIFGSDDCILATGNKLEADMPYINQFVMLDGVISIQGHLAQTTGETLTIDTCANGSTRIDLIVARFTHDANTLIDNVEIIVVKGTETSSAYPTTPTVNTGSIASGATVVDMVLYKLELDGPRAFITKVPEVRAFLPDYVSDAFIKKQGKSGDVGYAAYREDSGTMVYFGVGAGGKNHGAYSYNNDKWIIYNDESGVTRLPATDIRLSGHSSSIGSIVQSSPSSNRSCASGSWYGLCSITLPAGTWLIEAGARWSGNGSGSRQANVSSTSANNASNICVGPSGAGLPTSVRFTVVVEPTTSTRYYLNVSQTSGATLTCPAAGNGTGNFLRAVRLV